MARSRSLAAFVLAALTCVATPAPAQSHIRGWGRSHFDSANDAQSFVRISAGARHTVALRADGSVAAWGDNSNGQCELPVLPPGVTYVEIAAGGTHTLGLRSDGKVETTEVTTTHSPVPGLPLGMTYVEIAAGHHHSAARRSDGNVVTWGSTIQYGGSYYPWQGTMPPLPAGVTYVEIACSATQAVARRSDGALATTPGAQLPPLGMNYVEIAGGSGHFLARRSDGQVIGWGDNAWDQCSVPGLPPGITYVEIAAGGGYSPPSWGFGGLFPAIVNSGFSLARRSDGFVVAWGSSLVHCNVPALPIGLSVAALAAGYEHAVALISDGSVVDCGSNAFGQCNVPLLPAGVEYVEVAVGPAGTLARRSDGQVVIWGNGWTYTNTGIANVPPLPPGLSYAGIAVGGHHALAIRSDGSVVGWGDNQIGQCNAPAPAQGQSYVQVAAGYYHSVGLLSDGSVAVWGDSTHSQAMIPAGTDYVEVAAGFQHTAVLRNDGTIVVGGQNLHGEANVPPLPPGRTYVEVAAGFAHNVARRSDGSVVAWGDNTLNQSDVPPLPVGLTYVGIEAGWGFSLGRRSDGSSIGWGCNNTPGSVPAVFTQCNVPSLFPGVAYAGMVAGGWQVAALYGAAATIEALGPGCGGIYGSPIFSAGAPKIGHPNPVALAQGTANASGMLFYSAPPAAPFPISASCTVELDIATASPLVGLATDGFGSWSSTFAVPNDPGLAGAQVAMQIVVFGTPGPLGFDLSNGLIATVGY